MGCAPPFPLASGLSLPLPTEQQPWAKFILSLMNSNIKMPIISQKRQGFEYIQYTPLSKTFSFPQPPNCRGWKVSSEPGTPDGAQGGPCPPISQNLQDESRTQQ